MTQIPDPNMTMFQLPEPAKPRWHSRRRVALALWILMRTVLGTILGLLLLAFAAIAWEVIWAAARIVVRAVGKV